MSNTQFAFLKKENVPGREAWQKAIDELSFSIRLEIDPELQAFDHEGFLPCKFDGGDDEVGFELYYEPAEDVLDGDDDPLKELVDAGNNYCISLCWRGSMKDCATVMIASCALVKLSGAVVSYKGEGPYTLDNLIEETTKVIALSREED